jgi:hypothetical protein
MRIAMRDAGCAIWPVPLPVPMRDGALHKVHVR